METCDFQTAQRTLSEWLTPLVNEVRKASKIPPVVTEGSPIATDLHVERTVEVGGALLQLVVETFGQAYRPIVVVTERAWRKHRIGIGHSHNYSAMANGHPNYKKVVRNAVQRAQEIEAASQQPETVIKQRPPAEDLEVAQRTELSGVKLPQEMLAQRSSDGTYVIHIGTMRTGLEQVKKVASVLVAP